jgi:hypothetical protein
MASYFRLSRRIVRTVCFGFVLSLALVSTNIGIHASEPDTTIQAPPEMNQSVILLAGDESSTVRYMPSPETAALRPQTATVQVHFVTGVYTTSSSSSEYCQPWPAEARAAFLYAAEQWIRHIHSSVPIEIDACWSQLEEEGILGYSAQRDSFANFPQAPVQNVWYPVALANALQGTDLDPSKSDMYVVMNSARHSTGINYYGTDGNAGTNRYDFVSVVMHEIAHGIGFLGNMSVYNGMGSWGGGQSNSFPSVYTLFLINRK